MMECLVCNPEEVTYTMVAEGPYISVIIDNIFGDLRIMARGEYNCWYYPRFCPECGRKLREKSRVFG